MTKIDVEKLKQDILKSLLPTLTETIATVVAASISQPSETIKKKRGRPKKVKESEKLQPPELPINQMKFVREDISNPSTYVDDLSNEPELIETDKIICKPHKKNILRNEDTIIRKRKCTRNKDDNSVCGKEFEAFGQEYLCPKCAENVRNKNGST